MELKFLQARSPEGINQLKQKLKHKKFSQQVVADFAECHRETVGSMLKGRSVSSKIFKKVCEYLILDWTEIAQLETDIVPPENPNTQPQIPDEFSEQIEELIQSFCGREFVFEAIEQFFAQKPKGYFTVVGEPGIGKSALAAKYVKDHQVICYFNKLTNGRNRPEFFLDSIRAQLIHRYNLQGMEQAYLEPLLKRASQRLPSGERLIIVVDALDEVEKRNPTENLLCLPESLPDGVYFLLTRRPYSLETKYLTVSIETQKDLDLSAQEYEDFNQEDIKEYFWRGLRGELPKVDAVALERWVKARSLTPKEFVEYLAKKSEKNFMYGRHMLPAIARGEYNDLELAKLPQGLKEYYKFHWIRKGMDKAAQEPKATVLFILVAMGIPTSIKEMAEISGQEEVEVYRLFEREWYEYLTKQERGDKSSYSIYHTSYLNFLKGRTELAPHRDQFKAANLKLANYHQELTNYYLRGR